MRAQDFLEAWSEKYKRSINCNNPKGFSQRAHCQGRKKTDEAIPGKDYRGRVLRRHWGGFNGRAMPDDIKQLAAKHIKRSNASNNNYYINEYQPEWYVNTFRDPDMRFDDLLRMLTPYFTVMRIQNVAG